MFTLLDGRRVVIRPVQPQDRPLFAEGIRLLSTISSYRRFLSVRKGFSDEELHYLTEVDGHDHVAIGAVTTDGQGAGVGRYIRDKADPGLAEWAIVLLDSFQRQGLGLELARHLIDSARAGGITELHGWASPENEAIQRMLRKLGPLVVERGDGSFAGLLHLRTAL